MASLVGESDSAAGASAGEHAWTRERPPMYFGSVYQSKLLKLRALVLSGVYGNVEMIKSLNAYMLEHNLSADFVVIAGGLVRPTLSKHSSPVSAEATTSTLGDSATVLSAIEKIMWRFSSWRHVWHNARTSGPSLLLLFPLLDRMRYLHSYWLFLPRSDHFYMQEHYTSNL